MNTSLIEENFSISLKSAIKKAVSLAAAKRHNTYGVPHLALALLHEPTGLSEILSSMDKDLDYVTEWFEMQEEVYESQYNAEGQVHADRSVENIFDESERSQLKLGTDLIDAVCVFTAILRSGVVYSDKQLQTLGVQEHDILNLYNTPLQLRNNALQAITDNGDDTLPELLYCKLLNSNDLIEEGDRIVGRDKEVRIILESLEMKETSGILIVGDAGVGKSSIMKRVLKYLAESDDSEMNQKRVISLNPSKLLANTVNPHEVSKLLSDIFDKVKKYENVLLFIDNLNVLTDTSSISNSILHLITSEITEGKLQLISTINSDSYRKTIEPSSLNNKLSIIALEELDKNYMLQCLNNHKVSLEAHHQIIIADSAVKECIQHSKRYFKETKLPYAAINLLDKTLASVVLSNENAKTDVAYFKQQFATDADADVTLMHQMLLDKVNPMVLGKITQRFDFQTDDKNILNNTFSKLLETLEAIVATPITTITDIEVSTMVATITGIPLGKIQAEEKERLLGIDVKLSERVKGQDHAITTISDAIIESRSGLSNPKQPIGSFFFLGPTGTGKTELTKSLAELLFDDEDAMIRFDMSEFKEEHSAALLYGAPPGYVGYEEGGMLVNKIRQKPYAVVLFDEIEKAHKSVYDVFLQIMDEGQIHDKLGREGDFSNAIIIFTSNLGSDWVAEQFGKNIVPTSNQLIDMMSGYFRPEFLGRITEVVPFKPIDASVAQLIFKLQLSKLQKQLLDRMGITLTLSDEATDFLSEKGFSEKYGARPIAGVIRSYIKKVISRMIVAENVKKDDKVLLTMEDGNLVWKLI